MKKMLSAVLLGAGLCGLYAAENPALELFGDDITFYVSFDEGNGTADLADGSEKPVPIGSVTYSAARLYALDCFSIRAPEMQI